MVRVKLGRIDEVIDGEVVRKDISGVGAIALYNLAGRFYATDDLCSHGEASLSEGSIENGQIVCPFHGGSFDIASGEPIAAPCYLAIRSYAVHREGEDLYVELP